MFGPVNVIRAVRASGNQPPNVSTTTPVYGNGAVGGSRYQIAPAYVPGPVALRLAIQWTVEKNPVVMSPLTAISG